MATPAINIPHVIINDGMRDAGLLQRGESANSEELAEGMKILQDIINFEQTQGLKLWLQVDTAVTLVASQQTYTLLPGGDVDMVKPLRALQGYYLDANSNRRPIYPLSWDEWLRLSQVTQTGSISQYFINKKAASLEVSFWNIPDATAATGTAHLLLETQVTNPINLQETMNFPPEWRIFLRWALADEVCTGQPQAIMDRCASKAGQYRMALENWDVEDAPTRFSPDPQMLQNTGNFR